MSTRSREPWTPAEDSALKIYIDEPIRDLADVLERSMRAIYCRRSKLLQDKTATTGSRLSKVRDVPRENINAGKIINTRLIARVGEPTNTGKPWSAYDDAILKELVRARVPYEYIAEHLGRSYHSIAQRVSTHL